MGEIFLDFFFFFVVLIKNGAEVVERVVSVDVSCRSTRVCARARTRASVTARAGRCRWVAAAATATATPRRPGPGPGSRRQRAVLAGRAGGLVPLAACARRLRRPRSARARAAAAGTPAAPVRGISFPRVRKEGNGIFADVVGVEPGFGARGKESLVAYATPAGGPPRSAGEDHADVAKKPKRSVGKGCLNSGPGYLCKC